MMEQLAPQFPNDASFQSEATRNRQWLEMTLKAAGKGERD